MPNVYWIEIKPGFRVHFLYIPLDECYILRAKSGDKGIVRVIAKEFVFVFNLDPKRVQGQLKLEVGLKLGTVNCLLTFNATWWPIEESLSPSL